MTQPLSGLNDTFLSDLDTVLIESQNNWNYPKNAFVWTKKLLTEDDKLTIWKWLNKNQLEKWLSLLWYCLAVAMVNLTLNWLLDIRWFII